MAGLSKMEMRRLAARAAFAVAVSVAATMGAGGCGGDDGGTQPPTGEQILTGRDFSNLFFWNRGTLVFTRDAAVPLAGVADQDLWVWPADADAPEIALRQIDWSPPVWWPDIIVGDLL